MSLSLGLGFYRSLTWWRGCAIDCRWLLVCPSGSSPSITFSTFNTESSYDYVNIYSGNGGSANPGTNGRIARLSGSSVPASAYISDSGTVSMLVQLTSDGSVNEQSSPLALGRAVLEI